MIYCYDFSIRGKSHERDSIPCQDACHVIKCGKDVVIAAVADGLGSCERSDIASRIAVEKSVEYCKENLWTNSVESMPDLIRESFAVATDAIEDKAKEDDRTLSQYFTTLSLAVLWHDTLYYGQAGDSGIIALTHQGRFEKVTEQQQDEDDGVFHLLFSDKWQFGQFNEKVCSVLLATDGILFYLSPPLLQNEPVDIRVNKLRAWMDNRLIRIDELGEKAVKSQTEKSIKDTSTKEFRDDDLTVVVLVNTSVVPETPPDDYYMEPDWKELHGKRAEEYRRANDEYLRKTSERYVQNGIMKSTVTGDSDVSNDKDQRTDEKETDNGKASVNSADTETAIPRPDEATDCQINQTQAVKRDSPHWLGKLFGK